MACQSIDSDLIQRLRLEIAAQPDRQPHFDNLADVGRDRLRIHLERLFYGGEIAADCEVNSGGLELLVRRLTPYGVLAMHAALARTHSPVRRGI